MTSYATEALKNEAFNQALATLRGTSRGQWAQACVHLTKHLGPYGIESALSQATDPATSLAILRESDDRLEAVASSKHERRKAISNALSGDTLTAADLLLTLRDDTELGALLREGWPELGFLADGRRQVASHEHGSRGARTPLLDHTGARALGRHLASLENPGKIPFDTPSELGAAAFARLRRQVARIQASGAGAVLRMALLYVDISKGGTEDDRRAWAEAHIELALHNEASAQILEQNDTLKEFGIGGSWSEQAVLAFVRIHGLKGQCVRGEVPFGALAGNLRQIAQVARQMAKETGRTKMACVAVLSDVWHIMDICDTAAVRQGIMTAQLENDFRRAGQAFSVIAGILTLSENADIDEELGDLETRYWSLENDNTDALCQRLARLRQGRTRAGEAANATEHVVRTLGDDEIQALGEMAARTSFWYAEAASSMLKPETQLKLLAMGMKACPEEGRSHLTLEPMVESLRGNDVTVPYRVRLVEALLANTSLADILSGRVESGGDTPLSFSAGRIGGQNAVTMRIEESPEGGALLTLLGALEQKKSGSYHSALKMLCDLYHLRADEFDRVANEHSYLTHMNNSGDDKAKIIGFGTGSEILEIGPGGGVVLSLLEYAFPEAHIRGLDLSREVVDSLEARAKDEGRTWSVIAGDAFELEQIFGTESLDTIVCCSLLHEIYSYHESQDSEAAGKFQISSVRDFIKACYRCLKPGGRIVIRDGVRPGSDPVLLRLHNKDIQEGLDNFLKYFQARAISVKRINEDTVEMPQDDAMEFLYTYIWGPESFPYEVREQYGVQTYEQYEQSFVEWLKDEPVPGKCLRIEPSLRQYLQKGYTKRLSPEVTLMRPDGSKAELPASNAIWVIEKEKVNE